jgi:hypothetical protein
MSPKNAVIYRKGAKGAKGRKDKKFFLCELCIFAPLR